MGINKRLWALRIYLAKNQHATIIKIYAPTLDAEYDIKEDFYSKLDNIFSTRKKVKIVCSGDFNAKFGKNHRLWNRAIGKEKVSDINANETLLFTKCTC